MIVGNRAAPSLMLIVVTISINYLKLVWLDFSESAIKDGVDLITAPPPRVCNPVLNLLAIAAPTSTVVTVGMLARLLFPLQQAVPETTTDKQAGDKHRLLSFQLNFYNTMFIH